MKTVSESYLNLLDEGQGTRNLMFGITAGATIGGLVHYVRNLKQSKHVEREINKYEKKLDETLKKRYDKNSSHTAIAREINNIRVILSELKKQNNQLKNKEKKETLVKDIWDGIEKGAEVGEE